MRRLLAVLAVLLIGSQITWAVTSEDTKQAKEESAAVSDLHWVSPTEVTRLPAKAAEATKAALPGHDEFVEISSMPVMRTKAEPVYPPKARQNSVEADLWIRSLVDSKGMIQTARVSEATGLDPDLGFERAALLAAMDMEFEPAIWNKKPVAIWITYKVRFRMD